MMREVIDFNDTIRNLEDKASRKKRKVKRPPQTSNKLHDLRRSGPEETATWDDAQTDCKRVNEKKDIRHVR